MEIRKVNLSTINNGAAMDLFQEELGKVLRNINDISVKPDAVREISMKFKIIPSKDRLTASVTIQATSKLQSVQAHQSSMFLSQKQQGIEAYVTNPEQFDLGLSEEKPVSQKNI